MPEVPRVRTPIAAAPAAAILLAALRLHGIEPNREQAALLHAQLWLETAGGNACDNFNPGNITGESAFGFFRPAWFVVDENSSPKLRQLHIAMLDGKAPSKFRSYPEFVLGFNDYVLQLHNRFPSILQASATGDPSAMARAIVTSGYTPDAQPGTDRSLATLAKQLAPLYAQLPPAPPRSDFGPLLLLALVAWGLSRG